MKISKISASNLRYFSVFSYSTENLASLRPFSGISIRCIHRTSKISSFSCYNPKFRGYNGQILNLYFCLAQSHVGFRFYSVLSSPSSRFKKLPPDKYRPGASSKEAKKIVDILIGAQGVVELESKLNFLDKRLSIALVSQVLRVLNSKKQPALHFFHWIRHRHPKLGHNPEICSLVIDNCGHLNDYDSMRSLLNDFRMKGLPLTRKAFEYLPVMAVNEANLKQSTESIMIMLKEIGGICYLTGVHSLIEIFSVLGSFSMAKFVINRTEKRFSNYNLLFKGMCRRCEFGAAKNLMDEMRNNGYPLGQNYNYLISNLLKNGQIHAGYAIFREMKEKECPDELTYEVFICHYCNDGNLEVAFEFLGDMLARGLRPRLTTHAAFIRRFFDLHKYEEAYKYVVESDDKYSRPANYSFLARLYLKTGNAVRAVNVLSEMIEKGLRPNCKVYVEVRKRLKNAGIENLSVELEMKLRELERRT